MTAPMKRLVVTQMKVEKRWKRENGKENSLLAKTNKRTRPMSGTGSGNEVKMNGRLRSKSLHVPDGWMGEEQISENSDVTSS